jgi:hypothetical protein
MHRFRLALVLLASLLAIQQLGPQGKAPTAEAVDIEAVIWQFGKDYPGAQSDDTLLPVQTVYIKTHDATNWMSTYDEDPMAVAGPNSIRRLIDHYRGQGIEVVAWFVPKGGDVESQLYMAKAVLDSGVRALYADIEPFDGFCHLDCDFLAREFWWRLRQERPQANLGVIYDPRPWTWVEGGTSNWLAVANAALPMCYWELYVDQGVWGDPRGCVSQAHSDLSWLAPGLSLEYVPMLQGDTTGGRFLDAMDAAREAGASKISLWRRGVVTQEVWEAAWNIWEPSPVVAAAWPSYWVWSPCPWDGCILREEWSDALYVLYSGAKFPIPNPEALATMGRRPGDHWIVADGQLSMVADIPWDGTLLQEAGSGGVYVVYAGAKFPVPTPEALYALGLGAQRVHTIPPGGLSQISSMPREGSRFQEFSSATEWQMMAGAKFALPSVEVRDALIGSGVLEAAAYVVPDGALGNIPTTPQDGSRVREFSSGTEWQIAAGAKFPLADAIMRNQLVRNGALKWGLSVVPDGALAALPTVPREGSRVQELGGDMEWHIAGGMRFPIRDAGLRDAMVMNGQLSTGLTVIPQGALATIPAGPRDGTLVRDARSGRLYLAHCGGLYWIFDGGMVEQVLASGLASGPVLTVAGLPAEAAAGDPAKCGGIGVGG